MLVLHHSFYVFIHCRAHVCLVACCRYLDDKLSTRVAGSTAFVATRIEARACCCTLVPPCALLTHWQHRQQRSKCLTPDRSDCIARWDDNIPYQDRYVAWVENFTLGLQHGFTIVNNNKVQSFRAQAMEGRLNSGTGLDASSINV